jgi:hypothetical protein
MKRIPSTMIALLRRLYGVPQAHGLNPKVFIGLSALGVTVQILYYLPWLRVFDLRLAFLTLLRTLALVGPAYVAIRGRKIAGLVNISLVGSWAIGTAWHVCYFVYL